jgi:predicted AAA+ superfamily ATPase
MFKRYIKTNIYNALSDTPVVYIMGPRQSGKTTVVKDVINELKKQSNFISEQLKFYHYRDKDKIEVDILIENKLDEIIGVEIKATATLKQTDFTGLRKLKEIADKKFKIGVLLYDGDHTTSFGDKLFAVPIASLWS